MATLTSQVAAAPREAQSARFATLRRREQWRYLFLLAPALVFLVAFYGYPVAAMLMRAFYDPTWGVQNIAPLVEPSSTVDVLGLALPMNVYLRVFWITLQIALVTTVCTLLLGYPVAYALSSISPGRANLLMMFVLIPFWTSILVRSYAWMVLLGQEGIVNEALTAAGAIEHPIRLLNTRFAVYIGMVHILLPFMILPLYAVMRGIDRNLIRGGGGSGPGLPDVLLLVALAACALGYAEGARLGRTMPARHVICWALVLVAPVTLPLSAVLFTAQPPVLTGASLAGFAYVSVGSMFLGFFAWYAGLARIGVARGGQLQLVQPILTVVWSALITGESIAPLTVVTALAVLVFVGLTQRTGRPLASTPPADPPCDERAHDPSETVTSGAATTPRKRE